MAKTIFCFIFFFCLFGRQAGGRKRDRRKGLVEEQKFMMPFAKIFFAHIFHYYYYCDCESINFIVINVNELDAQFNQNQKIIYIQYRVLTINAIIIIEWTNS